MERVFCRAKSFFKGKQQILVNVGQACVFDIEILEPLKLIKKMIKNKKV